MFVRSIILLVHGTQTCAGVVASMQDANKRFITRLSVRVAVLQVILLLTTAELKVIVISYS